jgi:hypothetical protein
MLDLARKLAASSSWELRHLVAQPPAIFPRQRLLSSYRPLIVGHARRHGDTVDGDAICAGVIQRNRVSSGRNIDDQVQVAIDAINVPAFVEFWFLPGAFPGPGRKLAAEAAWAKPSATDYLTV